jgi:16S rRNA (guanine966-N2)-methyltransferase
MRIVSGSLKSRRIFPPKNLPVRPTTDLSKEALFNVLNNRYNFYDITVLDLFAGTGNISYEFGSRGTETITSVDLDQKCVAFINQTSKLLELPIQVIKSDVVKYLETSKQSFDIIFADPPYQIEEAVFLNIIEIVFEKKMIKEDGLLIIEHATGIPDFSKHPHLSFEKRYGGSVFSFFEPKP